MKIPIGTSIAPHNIELQKSAISSWLKLDFEVISLNSKAEIEQIEGHFPGVVFKEATRDASGLTGKPFVYLDDLLEVLYASGSDVCSILNSDIYLDVDQEFPGFLGEAVQGGLIFGSRIDVTSLATLEGQEYFQGFDYFFFSRSIIKEYRKTDFCLGVPWWDYWVPLFAILKGLPVKQLLTPIAYHLEHPIRWNVQYLTGFGDRLMDYLMDAELGKRLDEDFEERIDFSKKHSDHNLLAMFIVNFIFRNTEKIFYLSDEEKLAKTGVACYECSRKEMELDYYKERVRLIVNDLEDKLIEMRTSKSWRITAPLRKLQDKLHRK